MNLPQAPRRLAWAALAAAVVAAAAGLGGWLDATPDLTDRLRDDAFYEFVWAWNLARGAGPTVSDGVTTSGVQLAWSLLLVPFAALANAAALPTVAAWTGCLLHAATAWLWWRRTPDRVTGACLALCWLGHPLLVRESQNGQETALACACLSALWLWRHAGAAVFGSLALATVLARSELWLFVVALSFARHRAWSWRVLGVPLLTLLLPALANRLLGGGFAPDSGLPMAWLWHANHERLGADLAATLQQWWWYGRPVLLGGPWALASACGAGVLVFAAVRPVWPASLRALPALLVGAAGAFGVRDVVTAGWVALLLALFPAARRRRPQWRWCWLAAATAGVVLLHWAVRWYPRDYYVAPLAVAAFAAVRAFGRCRLLLLVFAVAQVADLDRLGDEPLAGQRELALAGAFVHEVLPPAERVGCFHSGIVTWFADTTAAPERARAVVNLDGVVDARAFAALRARRLSAWLDEQAIAYVLDVAPQFALDPTLPHASGHWFGPGFRPERDLVEVARFDTVGVDAGRAGADGLRLYRRCGRGAPPLVTGPAVELAAAPDGSRVVRWPATAGAVLEVELADGSRRALCAVDVDTVAFVGVPRERHGTGRLFVRGEAAPLLRLRTL